MEYVVKITDCGSVVLSRSNLNEVCVEIESDGTCAALVPATARVLAAALIHMADEIEGGHDAK